MSYSKVDNVPENLEYAPIDDLLQSSEDESDIIKSPLHPRTKKLKKKRSKKCKVDNLPEKLVYAPIDDILQSSEDAEASIKSPLNSRANKLKKKRRNRCKECNPCLTQKCGECLNCTIKTRRQTCHLRKCEVIHGKLNFKKVENSVNLSTAKMNKNILFLMEHFNTLKNLPGSTRIRLYDHESELLRKDKCDFCITFGINNNHSHS